MTETEYENDPRITAEAGGRGQWGHNPEHCEIHFVEATEDGMRIKVSAGGDERGLAVLVNVPKDALIDHIARVFGVGGGGDLLNSLRLSEAFAERANNIRSDYWKAQPLQALSLSIRTRNCLANMGIGSISELLSVSENELLNGENFGRKSLNEINRELAVRGLKLRTSKETTNGLA